MATFPRPGAGMEVYVYDVLNPNTNLLTRIPMPLAIAYEDVLSDVGSGTVQIAANTMSPALLASVLTKDNIWKIFWHGLQVFAFIGEQVQDDQLDPSTNQRTITVAGKGMGQWLAHMISYPGGWGTASVTPVQTFKSNTMASIILAMINQAHARGTIPWITTDGVWTAALDSNNSAWTDTNNLSVDAGTSVLDLVTQYAAAVPWDWHVDSTGKLGLWKQKGSTLTTQVRIQPVGALMQAQITTDNSNLFDVILVEDNNQGFTEVTDSATITARGRRESFTSSSSVIDATGRADLGYSLLQTGKVPGVQKLVQFEPTIGRQPYLNYNLGDIIAVEFPDGSVASARVLSIALNSGSGIASDTLGTS